MMAPPPRSPLFPYTTLFRSVRERGLQRPLPPALRRQGGGPEFRSEEHTSELQSHSFISYAVFCLKKHGVERVVIVAQPELRNLECAFLPTRQKLIEGPARRH